MSHYAIDSLSNTAILISAIFAAAYVGAWWIRKGHR